MNRVTGGWVGLTVVAAVAAGCGGGDEALSKPEYVKQANAVCKRFNTDVERQAVRQFAGIRDESDLTAAKARGFYETALPRFDKALEDLRALEPPEGDRETVEKIYEAGARERDKIETDIRDDRKVKALATTESPTPRFQQLAKDYGLDTCAQD
jgi:hypothetical protein